MKDPKGEPQKGATLETIGRGGMITMTINLVAEFIMIKKVYTFCSIRDHIIPKSFKMYTNSATKTIRAP